jgi:hypothetical protein
MSFSVSKDSARRNERYTVRSGSDDGHIDVVIFPNRLQIGLDDSDFNHVNVISGSLKVTESVTATEAVTGKILYYTYHNFTISSTSVNYIPINTVSESTSETNQGVGFQAPHDGQLKRVLIKVNGAWGSGFLHLTTIAFHKGGNGTEGVDSTALESKTVQLSSANTVKTASFSTATFSAGDTIAVSIDPYASDSRIVRMTCVWEYDTNT